MRRFEFFGKKDGVFHLESIASERSIKIQKEITNFVLEPRGEIWAAAISWAFTIFQAPHEVFEEAGCLSVRNIFARVFKVIATYRWFVFLKKSKEAFSAYHMLELKLVDSSPLSLMGRDILSFVFLSLKPEGA